MFPRYNSADKKVNQEEKCRGRGDGPVFVCGHFVLGEPSHIRTSLFFFMHIVTLSWVYFSYNYQDQVKNDGLSLS